MIQTFRRKPGIPFEAIHFTGSEENIKEICDWVVTKGGSAIYRAPQAPIYDIEREKVFPGFTKAIIVNPNLDAERYYTLELGLYITWFNRGVDPRNVYGFDVVDSKWFDNNYEEVPDTTALARVMSEML